MKILMNWINKIGYIISDGKRSYPLFFLEKRKEDDVGKNKAVTPRLAFPFCLNCCKARKISEKVELPFYKPGIKVELLKMFPR